MRLTKYPFGILFGILFLVMNVVACASSGHLDREFPIQKFVTIATSQPDSIWAPTINEKLKISIADYRSQAKLNTGETYGNSVRSLDLRNRCASDIDLEMQNKKCVRNQDVLKDPYSKKPLLDNRGSSIPMVVYLCPDGGVVRVKPEGDPTNKFKPQPLVSKALRYPYNSKFETFDDEVAKVDNFGNIIPKWTKDFNLGIAHASDQEELIQGWADDAHTDLKLNCDK
jgi:hypothetical protein